MLRCRFSVVNQTSPGRLCKAGNHKKKASRAGRSNGPLAVRAQSSGQQSLQLARRVLFLWHPWISLTGPFYPARGSDLSHCPSPKSFSSLSPLCLNLSVSIYPSLRWLLPRNRQPAASSSDVLALSISAFRSLLLPFLATSNSLPPRYEREQTSLLPRHRPNI